MTPWRPALRMARRDLTRHRARALLTCLLVALPVLVATVAALASYNSRWDLEQEARAEMGTADAELLVTPFAAVKPGPALWLEARPAAYTRIGEDRAPVRRDPSAVDLPALLPSGTALTPQPGSGRVQLSSGGTAEVLFADLSTSSPTPQVELLTGRAPSAPDEVAVPELMADELGLLTDGRIEAEAELVLADGTQLRVVGTVEFLRYSDLSQLTLAVPLDSVLAPEGGPTVRRYVADLPELARPELKQLATDLNAVGVAVRPRDAVLHPDAWGQIRYDDDLDLEPLVVGGTVILVGLLEVVLLVGAAFAVAARRQVRDLGLLATNGGAPVDVRRVLLAQGVVLGVGSSLVGVVLGVVAFRGLVPFWERLFGSAWWRDELDWRALALILVLGSLTSVVAALVPAWDVSRLTPVQALSGRFPVSRAESRAHRGAFVLAALGLVVLAAGGWATARTFGPEGSELAAAPIIAGVGLVLLVAGTVWATPYVVRRVAAWGRRLPLSGRYAFRDAGRHRFRSAAAVTALTITVGAAVLAAFGYTSLAKHAVDDTYAPNDVELYLDTQVAPERKQRISATLEAVLGPVEESWAEDLTPAGHPSGVVALGRSGYQLNAVDEDALLGVLAGRDPGGEALETFRKGGVVWLTPDAVFLEATAARPIVATTVSGRVLERWRLPVAAVEGSGEGLLGSALVATETADRLGWERGASRLAATAGQPITQEQLDRLDVHGLNAWSSGPDWLRLEQMRYAGVGAVGLLTVLVVGIAVALAAAESRGDVATLAAVGAGPWRRRSLGALHGLFLAIVGALLGVVVGFPAGLALTQADGFPGADVPWLLSGAGVAVTLLAGAAVGWAVTPSRLPLTRRTT